MVGSEVRLWAGNEKFPFGCAEYKVLVRYPFRRVIRDKDKDVVREVLL